MSKLDGYEAGDRVKLTLEGTVSETGDYFSVTLDGWKVPSRLHDSAVNAPTFHIERIAQPVKVGDMVTWDGTGEAAWKLVAIEEGRGVLVRGFAAATLPLADLRHA